MGILGKIDAGAEPDLAGRIRAFQTRLRTGDVNIVFEGEASFMELDTLMSWYVWVEKGKPEIRPRGSSIEGIENPYSSPRSYASLENGRTGLRGLFGFYS